MLKNEDGMSVVIVFGIMILLGLLAFALVNRTVGERQITTYLVRYEIAFSAAEGGLEKALLELKRDFADNTTPSWADSFINDIRVGPDSIYDTLYNTTSLGDGGYFVELKNVPDGLGGFLADEIWVKSTGIADGGVKRVIEAYVEVENLSPWDNVISAGKGSADAVIKGNALICGSVHVLGEGLTPFDEAIEMSGGAGIRNYYDGMEAALLYRIPPLPTTIFNGEEVQTLEATLRVKHGRVNLSGTGTVGKPDILGNDYKETIDGVYVTDGYGGTAGVGNIYSDNGTESAYDLEDIVQFPRLDDPYTEPKTGTDYSSYQEYLKSIAYVVTDAAELTVLSNITPNSTFTIGDATNYISMDSATLAINGVIYIDNGGDLNMNIAETKKTITYTGKGDILVTGNVNINVNLLTPYSPNSFPTNILGVMTPNNITFNAANINVMGVFLGEDRITVKKQTDFVGSIVSNYLDLQQTPHIYQVPVLATNLSPNMIAGGPVWVIGVRTWRELKG